MGKQKRGRGRSADAAPGTIEPGGQPADDKAEKDIRYAEINRAVRMDEVDSVKAAAQQAGLWRFVEASEHAGFS